MSLPLAAFRPRFRDEQSCADYLSSRRWPNGFVCPGCGGRRAYLIKSRGHSYECLNCRRQTSLTAGTVMHRSKLPLQLWFSAAHLIATHRAGISSRDLARRFCITYKTAWLLKQKLRHSMNSGSIGGTVEVGLTELTTRTRGFSLSDPKLERVFVAVALEVNSYQVRLAAIPDDSAAAIKMFIKDNVKPGARLRTDLSLALSDYLYDPQPFEAETPLIFFFLKEFVNDRDESVHELLGKFAANQNDEVAFDAILGIIATHEPASYRDVIRHNYRPDFTT
jgi:Transposase zinc-ribbon domain